MTSDIGCRSGWNHKSHLVSLVEAALFFRVSASQEGLNMRRISSLNNETPAIPPDFVGQASAQAGGPYDSLMAAVLARATTSGTTKTQQLQLWRAGLS